MPEANDPLVERFRSAVAVVESRWERLGLQPRKLDGQQLAAYRGRAALAGWRFGGEFSDGIRRLDVIVPAGFPSSPARIALIDRPPFLQWPHVEKDGVLCLVPDHATLSVDDAYDGILLVEAFRLIEASIRGELDEDFRAEFLTYWGHAEKGTPRTVLSLLNPAPPSRRISVWEGKKRTIIAEDDAQIRVWLRNFAPYIPASKIKPQAAVFAWLDHVPLPAEYPSTAKAVYGLADRAGAAGLVLELALETRPRTFVILGAETPNGPALATTVVNRPKVVRGRDPLTSGFRPSFVPQNVLHTRFFSGTSTDRNSVDRVDPDWIHGRGHDARVRTLRGATVGVLGCGSVGAPVALTLARAGVGKLVCVDKQTLKGANVGRHTLGVGSVGDFKAMALTREIRTALPMSR